MTDKETGYSRVCVGCGNDFRTENYRQQRCKKNCGKDHNIARNAARKLERDKRYVARQLGKGDIISQDLMHLIKDVVPEPPSPDRNEKRRTARFLATQKELEKLAKEDSKWCEKMLSKGHLEKYGIVI